MIGLQDVTHLDFAVEQVPQGLELSMDCLVLDRLEQSRTLTDGV